MKKALIITYNDLNNSGVPNVIYQTIKALHNRYSFDVLIFENDTYFYQKLIQEKIDVNILKYNETKPKNKIGRLFWHFNKRPHNHYLFMSELLKNNKYDVIHSFKEYDSWSFFKAAKEAGINKRIFHRNINPEQPHKVIIRILEKRNKRLTLKYSSLLVGVSELCCKSAFENRECSVLYNCYDEDRFNFDVKNKLTSDELVLTQVASYSDNKNQLFTLKVFNELKKIQRSAKLNLVGATDVTPYYQSLIEYVKNNNLENDVSFIKKSDSVNELYKRTTFVIIPSIREGFSLVAVEAQACGIMVFASSTVPKEVDCGCIQFLDLSKSPEFWASEINNASRLLKNKRMLSKMDKFSFERFRLQLEKLYE